uniref:Glutathione peroxidase n=1 Tax=Saccoglossus kowalevskii TaxID=10224 RepID=A0ABM0GLU8_SACKO|nr:PREDICTED: glutathione peroxidase 1-like [Saccoglossus kowalevskii]
MKALVIKYTEGFNLIALPCNQFELQEPGTNAEILPGLKCVRPGGGFEPNFEIYAKVEVNGRNAHPLFTHLKEYCPPVKREIGDPSLFYWSPITVGDITWNFNKFLVDHKGIPYKRYESAVEPAELQADIELLLSMRREDLEQPGSRFLNRT